jgi:hypothetical protein
MQLPTDDIELQAAKLSKEERDKLPDSAFAVPGKRLLVITDATHTKLAWDMVDRTEGLTPEERAEARRRILRRAKELGIDTSNWTHSMKASAVQFSFSENLENPNRMPFKGVLTYFDAPSDKPPGGSGGRRVLIPSSVGIPALESLKGMGVNLASEMDDHQVTHKIGVITDAYTGRMTEKGLEVIVEGHIFARDFPREAAMIKLNQAKLGFSYETANTLLASQEIDGEEVAVVQSLVFTGAAILFKDAAAYQSTSIAASKEQKEDHIEVTAEELKAMLEGFKADLLASVDAKLEAAAKNAVKAADNEEEDEADKLQQEQADNPKKGTKKVAAEKEANGGGEVKASADIAELVKAAVAEALAAQKPAEVQASAQPPQRKSFAPGTLLAKYDVKAEGEDLYAAIDKVAEKAGLDLTSRLAMKLEAWRSQHAK